MENQLTVIDGETLMDMRLPPTRFCVQTLLPQGVTVLGGAPKVGKRWLVLDLCIRIAKGESIWNLPTAKGTTLMDGLEYFPESLRVFREQVTGMLELYFEPLTRRSAEVYTTAYGRYFTDMAKASSLLFGAGSFEQSFPTKTKFLPMTHKPTALVIFVYAMQL